MLALVVSCRTEPIRRADYYERQIQFLDSGEEAPFEGLLITERLFMELFEDAEHELLGVK